MTMIEDLPTSSTHVLSKPFVTRESRLAATGRMAKAFKAVLAVAGIMGLVIATAPAASAMDPGYCQTYARAAVTEFQQASATPACGSQSGPRWHDNFDVHLNWCLANSFDEAQSEWKARRDLLAGCVRAANPPPSTNGSDCCPNSMLVCPLGRHFCN
jgi:hypothetical protein